MRKLTFEELFLLPDGTSLIVNQYREGKHWNNYKGKKKYSSDIILGKTVSIDVSTGSVAHSLNLNRFFMGETNDDLRIEVYEVFVEEPKPSTAPQPPQSL